MHITKLKNLVWNNGINNLGKFLIARMLYADGLNAIIVMGGIFAVHVFNLEIKDLLILSILMNITAFTGAILGGFANDKLGSKSVIIFSLIGLIISSGIILFVKVKIIFFILASINGLFIGPIQSASRVYYAKSIPDEKKYEFFGFYSFSGKVTSFIGPILFGTISYSFSSPKLGMASLLVLFAVGLLILTKVKNDRRVENML